MDKCHGGALRGGGGPDGALGEGEALSTRWDRRGRGDALGEGEALAADCGRRVRSGGPVLRIRSRDKVD